jgi:hypothetical protein
MQVATSRAAPRAAGCRLQAAHVHAKRPAPSGGGCVAGCMLYGTRRGGQEAGGGWEIGGSDVPL